MEAIVGKFYPDWVLFRRVLKKWPVALVSIDYIATKNVANLLQLQQPHLSNNAQQNGNDRNNQQDVDEAT